MNKRIEDSLKKKVEYYIECTGDYDVINIINYVTHEWHEPLSLSMLLLINNDVRQQYVAKGEKYNGLDELQGLLKFKRNVYAHVNDLPKDFTDEEITIYSFDIEFTCGVCGCLIANPKNHSRFKRAILQMFGKWDGLVAPKTYYYITRRLNYIIKEESDRRAKVNTMLPANLQLPIA